MTSVLAPPALVFVQATAITCKVPLKAGRSKLIRARPSGPTLTTPEKRASGSCVGRSLPRWGDASPPDRIAPREPCRMK
jgi:hypothetical protein